MRRNQSKFARTALYTMKHRYGVPVDLYHTLSVTDNSQTGQTITIKEKHKIKKAIILPMTFAREMKPFGIKIPGEEIDSEVKQIIIDYKDLPLNFKFDNDDYLITHISSNRLDQPGKRFNIEKIEFLEDDISILITAKYTEGGQRGEIIDLSISDKLILIETGGSDGFLVADFPATFPLSL